MCGVVWWRPAGRVAVLLLMVLLAPLAAARQVAGWVETAVIQPGRLEVHAKLDTGAETSSLHCECFATFMRNDHEWVRFTVANKRGEKVQMEREVVRHAVIKRHFGGSQERLVITLPICLGGVLKEEEVNVVDRSGLKYQLLLGRNYLAGDFVVDPGARNLLSTSCPNAAAQD